MRLVLFARGFSVLLWYPLYVAARTTWRVERKASSGSRDELFPIPRSYKESPPCLRAPGVHKRLRRTIPVTMANALAPLFSLLLSLVHSRQANDPPPPRTWSFYANDTSVFAYYDGKITRSFSPRAAQKEANVSFDNKARWNLCMSIYFSNPREFFKRRGSYMANYFHIITRTNCIK